MKSSILLPVAGLSAISVSAPSNVPARPADSVAAQETGTIADLRTLLREAGALSADERQRLLAAMQYDPRLRYNPSSTSPVFAAKETAHA